MPENKGVLGSDLARLDATSDEDIARQIAEDPDTALELIPPIVIPGPVPGIHAWMAGASPAMTEESEPT